MPAIGIAAVAPDPTAQADPHPLQSRPPYSAAERRAGPAIPRQVHGTAGARRAEHRSFAQAETRVLPGHDRAATADLERGRGRLVLAVHDQRRRERSERLSQRGERAPCVRPWTTRRAPSIAKAFQSADAASSLGWKKRT